MNLPQACVCGESFSEEHAFSCPCEGFPFIHHNEVQDLTASLLSVVYCDVGVEPALQLLDHKPLQYATANIEDGTHLDVAQKPFCALLIVFHCQGAIVFMSRRSVELMMNGFGRWRELAFPLSFFQPLEVWVHCKTKMIKKFPFPFHKTAFKCCFVCLFCFCLFN